MREYTERNTKEILTKSRVEEVIRSGEEVMQLNCYALSIEVGGYPERQVTKTRYDNK